MYALHRGKRMSFPKLEKFVRVSMVLSRKLIFFWIQMVFTILQNPETCYKHWPPRIKTISQYFCLFVCLEFMVPLENFSRIWRRYHCRWRALNSVQCSALMTINQCNTHCNTGLPFIMVISWVPMTLTPVAKVVTTCFYDLGRIPIPRMRGERSTSMPPRRLQY